MISLLYILAVLIIISNIVRAIICVKSANRVVRYITKLRDRIEEIISGLWDI